MANDIEQIANPLAILQNAIDKGISPEQLGKLMDLAERWKAMQDKEAYTKAIAAFQAECPPVKKLQTATIKGAGNPWSYRFANYADVMRVARPLLAKYNIALAFSSRTIEKSLHLTLKTSVGAHSETHELEIPIPAMTVNDAQRHGAAFSYAKRYLVQGALNIVVEDEDSDAEGLIEKIGEEELRILAKLIKDTRTDVQKFCAWLGVAELGDIPMSKYDQAVTMLSKKKRKMEKQP